MALRNVRIGNDPILRKISKEVKEITPSILTLLDDMSDTMHKRQGIGLAAPQVGVLRRVIIIDIGEGKIEMINPEIIEESGLQQGMEGCLSLPEQTGFVQRPQRLKLKGLNRHGEEILIEADGLLAIVFCHEIDHLNGILFKDKAIEPPEGYNEDEDYYEDEEKN